MPLFTCTVHISTYTFICVLKQSTGFELRSPAPLPRPVTTTLNNLFLSRTFLMTLLTCALHSNHSNLWWKIPNFPYTYMSDLTTLPPLNSSLGASSLHEPASYRHWTDWIGRTESCIVLLSVIRLPILFSFVFHSQAFQDPADIFLPFDNNLPLCHKGIIHLTCMYCHKGAFFCMYDGVIFL
jgi:hypothetical protein